MVAMVMRSHPLPAGSFNWWTKRKQQKEIREKRWRERKKERGHHCLLCTTSPGRHLLVQRGMGVGEGDGVMGEWRPVVVGIVGVWMEPQDSQLLPSESHD